MNDSLLLDILTVLGIIGLGVWFKLSTPTKSDLQNLDTALATVLQGLAERLSVLDDMVDMLPSLVPSVNLTNQNPLISLIEAFQTMRGQTPGSNSPPLMRDASGRFDYGSTEKESNYEEATEAEIIFD